MGRFPFGVWIAVCAAGVVLLSGLAVRSSPDLPAKPKMPWKNAYWIWAGEAAVESAVNAQLLYVELHGTQWPHNLRAATEYVVVRRLEPGTKLTRANANALADSYKAAVANSGGANVSGFQIDYDAPVSQLKTYAEFLEWMRERLPLGTRLSITALLDWFRPETSVAKLIHAVDEFVPQFYDAGATRDAAGIAEPIDPAKWSPVFNQFKTPYRVGISTFGRISRRRTDVNGRSQVHYFRDASPMDFALRSGLQRSIRTTAARELVVHYDITVPLPERPDLQLGDAVEITFPTEASVGKAYDAVRALGDYCAGAIFFRWPTHSENVSMMPDVIEKVIAHKPLVPALKLDEREAACLERRCMDLYLDPGSVARSENHNIRIIARGELELFLPAGPLRPVQGRFFAPMSWTLPAYAGFGKIYLGRAISTAPLHFEMMP